MIQKTTLRFLEELRQNNNRDWFAENRLRYELARADVIGLTERMLVAVNEFEPEIGFPDPKKVLFRIYRDVRFSPNKEPYKTNMGVVLRRGGKLHGEDSCYYIHIEPGRSFLACGLYSLTPPRLKRVRQFISDEWLDFEGILAAPDFARFFGRPVCLGKTLKKVPMGFSADSPAAEYLKMTDFTILHPVTDREMQNRDFVAEATETFRAAKPFNDFLNAALEAE